MTSNLQRDMADRYHHFAPKIGPHSGRHRLAKVDRRTKEGQLLDCVRAELTRHVGGNPSAVQRALIERCCWLSLRIAMLDKKLASGRDFTEVDSNVYLAWSNTLARTVARLGLGAPAPASPTLSDYLSKKYGEAA
jgi:hypothetical protein